MLGKLGKILGEILGAVIKRKLVLVRSAASLITSPSVAAVSIGVAIGIGAAYLSKSQISKSQKKLSQEKQNQAKSYQKTLEKLYKTMEKVAALEQSEIPAEKIPEDGAPETQESKAAPAEDRRGAEEVSSSLETSEETPIHVISETQESKAASRESTRKRSPSPKAMGDLSIFVARKIQNPRPRDSGKDLEHIF